MAFNRKSASTIGDSIKTLPCFITEKGGLWKRYSLEQSFEGQSFLILTNRSRVWPVNHWNHHRLDELIHGSETAKRALREKDEGILIDRQKTRKSTTKDKDSLKKQKKIDLICVQIFQDAARCPL